MGVTVQRGGPGFSRIRRDIERLKKSDVLVGIPQATTQRKDEPINNSSLLFILSNGSPLRGIPATPILEPAVEKSKALITPQLAAAGKALIENKPRDAEKALGRAGTIAVNAAKRMFTDNDWPANAPSTIRQKGSDRRNLDTGALRRAITSVVRIAGRDRAASS